jgi:hypothetical protein
MFVKRNFSLIATLLVILLVPSLGFGADVQQTLESVRDHFVGRIMPILGAFGLIFAAFSFFTGNANARSHLILAIVGAIIGFTAQGIMNLVQGLVR